MFEGQVCVSPAVPRSNQAVDGIQTKHQLQHELWAGNRMTTMALLACFVPGLGSRNGETRREWPCHPGVTQVTRPPASAVAPTLERPWSYAQATDSARTRQSANADMLPVAGGHTIAHHRPVEAAARSRQAQARAETHPRRPSQPLSIAHVAPHRQRAWQHWQRRRAVPKRANGNGVRWPGGQVPALAGQKI